MQKVDQSITLAPTHNRRLLKRGYIGLQTSTSLRLLAQIFRTFKFTKHFLFTGLHGSRVASFIGLDITTYVSPICLLFLLRKGLVSLRIGVRYRASIIRTLLCLQLYCGQFNRTTANVEEMWLLLLFLIMDRVMFDATPGFLELEIKQNNSMISTNGTRRVSPTELFWDWYFKNLVLLFTDQRSFSKFTYKNWYCMILRMIFYSYCIISKLNIKCCFGFILFLSIRKIKQRIK